jgi:hypothetical protein
MELDSLSNEHLLRQLLLEMYSIINIYIKYSEPKLEQIGGNFEISLDSSFGIRYANIVSIMNIIENYLEKSAEKGRFTAWGLDLKSKLKINDFLKNDQKQLILISEILVFLSAISSKVDQFLDKLEDAEDKYIHLYCAISDKYLTNISNDSVLNVSSHNQYNRLYSEDMKPSQSMRNIQGVNDKLQKKCEELIKEKENLLKSLQESEKEISLMKEKQITSERNYSELEFKYKDSTRENEYLKNSNKSNIKVQEELLNESILINQLKTQLSQKDMEIEDIKKDYELQIKSYNDKITQLSEKLEVYSDKISAMKSLSNENEKLKIKIKELSLLKDKQMEYDEMVLNLESKIRMIDTLNKEKQSYISQLEKANKDMLTEKEKCRQSEYERKRLEFELNDLKKENSRMENNFKNKELQFQNYNNLNDNIKRNSNASEICNDNKGNFLMDLDQSSIYIEIDKTKEERIKLLEKEIDELRFEKSELIRNYKIQSEEINNINAERDKFFSQLEDMNMENKKIINERDKLALEKEKLLLKIQKIDLDIQRTEITTESEKKKSEDEISGLQDKIKKIANENENLKKEMDNNRKDLELSKNEIKELNEKFLKEKQILNTDFQKELEKLKTTSEKESNILTL